MRDKLPAAPTDAETVVVAVAEIVSARLLSIELSWREQQDADESRYADGEIEERGAGNRVFVVIMFLLMVPVLESVNVFAEGCRMPFTIACDRRRSVVSLSIFDKLDCSVKRVEFYQRAKLVFFNNTARRSGCPAREFLTLPCSFNSPSD